MGRTRKNFRGGRSRKLKRRSSRSKSQVRGTGGRKSRRGGRRSVVQRGGTGWGAHYSKLANYRAEGVAPQHTFRSLPAEIPVSSTGKVLGNFSAFDFKGKDHHLFYK